MTHVRNAAFVLITVAIMAIAMLPARAHAEDLCCKVRWVLQTASGSVQFTIYTCCPAPYPEHCTVTVTSQWVKWVPVVTDPIYDCSEEGTYPIGACFYTMYRCVGAYSVDTGDCYFCPCFYVPEGEITLMDLLNRLDTGELIRSNQCYCCGGSP